ncbi:MAG: 4-hydroxy-3-methylbut-2-enyl diphosphate reductase [Thermodesulfovibrionia bacterium]
MKIMVADKAGFCFGVKRAIDIAFDLAKEAKDGVYTFGPIIHNPQVVERLKQEGIDSTDDIHSGSIKTLIIRTHGVPPDVYKETERMGYRVVDATCPFVKKAQRYAMTLKDEGYQILIVGNREHPEVKGLIGFAGDDVITIEDAESIPPLKRRVGIIVQTTQRIETLQDVVLKVIGSAREIKIFNTICDYTARRVKETEELAKKVDMVIVVGGKNSSNTTQLYKLSKKHCEKVYHVETVNEIERGWFDGVEGVGITGGASTPNWIIEEIVEKVKEISDKR